MTATPPVASRPAFTRVLVVCLLFCQALVGCAPHRAIRTTPELWELRGSVVAVEDGTVEIRHKTGRVITVTLDDRTTYTRHHEPTNKADLRRGVRVAIAVERTEQADRALRIELFGKGS